MTPPFDRFTAKARDAIRRSHELAIERGQNHVNATHLLAALLLQDESVIFAVLDRIGVDTVALTDAVIDTLESNEAGPMLSQSYQIFLTPDFAKALELSVKAASEMGENRVSTEHLFLSLLSFQSPAREFLNRFNVSSEAVTNALRELENDSNSR